ncbi:MAG TPA: hypothetical protein PLW81_11055 [Thiobacillaceae bacterium]|nr:hypothetical protein [Thiobacillaceae bacterium]
MFKGFPGIALPILALLALPAQASKSVDEILLEAERSPLLRAKFPAAEAQRRGLGSIPLDTGVRLNFAAYLNTTSLKASSRFQPLFRPEVATVHLQAPPTYSETVTQLADRVLVDRKLTLKLKPGACRQANLPAFVADQCFLPKRGQLSRETREALQSIRDRLRAPRRGEEIIEGLPARVAARAAAQLSDEELLDLILNYQEREIRLLSHLPTQLADPRQLGQRAQNWDQQDIQLSTALPAYTVSGRPGAASPSLVYAGPRPPAHAVAAAPGPAQTLAESRHFLTGFTLGREISDKYEYTFAKGNWWHDRYYLRLSYHVGAGIGLRAPFQVRVEAKEEPVVQPAQPAITPAKPTSIPAGLALANKPKPAAGPTQLSVATHRRVKVSVAPEDLTQAWQGVGLDKSRYFDGREFVLQFGAGCGLKASIPGPNVDLKCPTPQVNASQDIVPVIGTESTSLPFFTVVPGEVSRLGVSFGISNAWLDLGLASKLNNGRIKLRVSPFQGSQIQNLAGPDLLFDSRAPLSFILTPLSGGTQAGFTLDNPRYRMNAEFSPGVQGRVNLDLGIYEFNKTVGPFILDILSVEQELELGHHEDTVAQHRFQL